MLGISVGTSGARGPSAALPVVPLPATFIPQFAEHTGDLITLPSWLESDPPATRVYLPASSGYVMDHPAEGRLAATPLAGLAPGGRMALDLEWYAQADSSSTRMTVIYVDDTHRVYWSRAAARFVVEWGGVVVQSDPGAWSVGAWIACYVRMRSSGTQLLLTGPGGASGSYSGPAAPPLGGATAVQLFQSDVGTWVDKIRFEVP